MTERQERFCVEYARCGNATEAYRNAGYSTSTPASAWVSACKLLRNPKVKARVEALSMEMKSAKMMDIAERREKLAEIARDEESTKQDVIKAIDTLNKMDGAYLNRTEITGGMPVVICDDLTEDKRQSSVG